MSNDKKTIVKVGDVEGAELRFFVAKKETNLSLYRWRQILVQTKHEINTYKDFTHDVWYRESYNNSELRAKNINVYYIGAKNFE